MGGLLLAATIPVGLNLALAAGLQVLGAPTLHALVTMPALAVLQVLGAYVAYRCGVAFVRLQCAPIYPRECFYGQANIAPEKAGRHESERFWMTAGCALVLLPSVLASTILLWGQPAPILGLAAGLLVETYRAGRMMHAESAQQLEKSIRGRYLLYLRSFGHSRSQIALATLRAASPMRALMIVSPRRIESCSLFWYGLSVLRPLDFGRLHIWSTVDTEWDRVVASCMARSLGIVVDCAGVTGALQDGQGLSMELGISLGFAADHQTAYTLEPGQSLPSSFPVPALLRVERGWWWMLRNHGHLVARLRAVTRRALPAEEQEYLDAHYSHLAEHFQDAMVGDGILALREGREDPRPLLLARRADQEQILPEYKKPSGALRSDTESGGPHRH